MPDLAYFDRHPNLFRGLFSVPAVLLLTLAVLNLYQNAALVTDENFYANPPSLIYIVENIPGVKIADLPREQWGGQDGEEVRSSPRVGDLLLTVNGNRPDSVRGVHDFIRASQSDSVDIGFYRSGEQRGAVFRVHKAHLTEDFVYTLPPVANVIDVLEGGASDRAGMRRGDLIIRINKLNFNDVNEADKILRQAKVGSVITYDILRANRVMTLQVEVASFGLSFTMLSIFLTGSLWMALGIFIALMRAHIHSARLTGPALLLLGFFIATFFNRSPFITSSSFGVLRDFGFTAAIMLGLPLWFHSLLYFPREHFRLPTLRWRILIPYLLGAVTLVAAIFFENYFSETIAPVAFPAVIVLLFLFHFANECADFFRRKESFSVEERLLRNFVYGAVLLTAISSVFVISNDRGDLFGYTIALLAAIPIIYFYLISRFRLLGFRFRLRRNTQYTLVTWLWGLSVALLIIAGIAYIASFNLDLPNLRFTGVSVEVVREPLGLEERVYLETICKMSLALILLAIVWYLRRGVQQVIDQKFHRSRRDFSSASTELTELLFSKVSTSDLARELVIRLAQILHIKRMAVMLLRDRRIHGQSATGLDMQEWESICLTHAAAIVEAIPKFKSEFNVDYLPDGVKNALRHYDFQYIIPMRSDELTVGALFVGEKLSETALSWEDLSFLTTAAAQASVTIENAFLYEDLAEQERMKHELSIARRIQLESLPQKTPLLPGLDIAGISIPALEVGGDFFEYLDPGDSQEELTVVIGDVSGKGTSAALYMSKVQGILRSLHPFCQGPKDILTRTNGLLAKDLSKESFVTALAVSFDTGAARATIARAGHGPMLHYIPSSDTLQSYIPRGIGLGLVASDIFGARTEELKVDYQSGDIFVFFTDGITEAKGGNGPEFGEEDLHRLLESVAESNAHYIRDKIITTVQKYAEDFEQHDDQTLVVVKITDVLSEQRQEEVENPDEKT